MPPPAADVLPLAMVTPDIVVVPLMMSSTAIWLPPLMTVLAAPAPVKVVSPFTSRSPLTLLLSPVPAIVSV